MDFTCPDQRFEEPFFREKDRLSSAFSDLERKTITLLAITSGSFVKTAFYVSREAFR